ncbi:MAG TPA: ATP-binding protein [bacterium]
MIDRPEYINRLTIAIKRSPITALLGPRQCGKTTLARMIAQDREATYFDLESQEDLARLQNPELALSSVQNLIIIDEIQQMPELFNTLRVLVDREPASRRFLILGSASPTVVRSVSESLAGRVEFVDLAGFNLLELGAEAATALWVRGGFPRSFLADNDEDSFAWREGFVRTFLERDLPQLGISFPPLAMRRFWTMLAHYHGQIWNASELARSMGANDKTVRSYLDLLTGTYMVRQLQPWHENVGKRQVKAPKIYLRDTGLLHSLLTLPNHHALTAHPRMGASWEGFVLEQIMLALQLETAYFWATHQGTEIDLFFIRAGKRFGIEVKYSESPKITRSAHIAMKDLNLTHLWFVYPGNHSYPIDEKISAIPLASLSQLKEQVEHLCE